MTEFRILPFDKEGFVEYPSPRSATMVSQNHSSLFLIPSFLFASSSTLRLSSITSAMGTIGLFSTVGGSAQNLEAPTKFSLPSSVIRKQLLSVLYSEQESNVMFPRLCGLIRSIVDFEGRRTVMALEDRNPEEYCLCVLLQPACSVQVEYDAPSMTEIGLFPGTATALHFQKGELIVPSARECVL